MLSHSDIASLRCAVGSPFPFHIRTNQHAHAAEYLLPLFRPGARILDVGSVSYCISVEGTYILLTLAALIFVRFDPMGILNPFLGLGIYGCCVLLHGGQRNCCWDRPYSPACRVLGSESEERRTWRAA